jgi:large subunit ribosomal protein L31e
MAKEESKQILERTYNIPLRREFLKVPRYRKTQKATKALREFLAKHMKSEDIKIGKSVNEHLWKHGIQNPPHHVKVTVTKDDKGVVKAELFGLKEKLTSKERKAKKEEKKKAADEKKAEKKEVKVEKKPAKEDKKEEA